jgi:uncharacterized protein (TIGR02678 family)
MERQFDEKAKEGLNILFERFWVLREHEPEAYRLIREREKVLTRYIDEKFGYRLIIHRHFIKLEKTPVDPKAWMGIEDFQKPMEYALFCCSLAFLEEKAVNEQFLLSNLCEAVQGYYPGELGVDWTNYEHRKSFIRVIRFLTAHYLLETIEGETDRFAHDEEQEVLYEATVYSRYFMRSYPKDLFQYNSMTDIMRAEWEQHTDGERRKRVYRQLLLSPVVYRKEQEDADFYYIRNMQRRLREDLESHTSFQLEVFKNAAMLTMAENKSMFTLFPGQKAIHDLILQLAGILREQAEQYPPDEWGEIHLTPGEWDSLIRQLKKRFESGWSKAYRTAAEKVIGAELVNAMEEWEMIDRDRDTGLWVIRPLLGRIIGAYPEDFDEKRKVSSQ